MTVRDWLTLGGILGTLIGVIYNARRAGKSSDRAQKAALQASQDQATMTANTAENSSYTRAQDMIEAAAATQQKVFDAALLRMEKQIADMQRQIDSQELKIDSQQKQISENHIEIQSLQRSRDRDRQEYTRYIQKLLTLLEQHNIVYPVPPSFFEG